MALPRHRLFLLATHCHSYKQSLPCTSSINCTSARYSLSTDSNQDDDNQHSLAGPMHSLLRSRRTATRLVHSLDDSKRQQEQDYIAQALNRAVACAQMAPNHKRTEPFSFKKIMASSQSAQTLAEISYQITLNKSSSSQPVAERKRQKWLEIPAFLVALIHDNQDPSSTLVVTCDKEAFQELPFMPPKTERQLEDVSSIFFFFSMWFSAFVFIISCKKISNLESYHTILVCCSVCGDSKCAIELTRRRNWKQMGNWADGVYSSLSRIGGCKTNRSYRSACYGWRSK